MYNNVQEYLLNEMEEGEEVVYSFYVVKLASIAQFAIFQMAAILDSKHTIVTFTNKRLLISEMDSMGRMTGVTIEAEGSLIEGIRVKRGLFKTKVFVNICGQEILFSPNNICIGMPYHKESLIEMAEKYS